MFNKAELQGVPAEPAPRFSTMAACFSGGLVSQSPWSRAGRLGARRAPGDWPRRLFSGHQDNSAAEPPKSAENAKKEDPKQYKQVVTP